MTPGPYVFGDYRQSLWIAWNANLTDKLKHILPRLRAAIPNLTDLMLPPEATKDHRRQVLDAGFFHHMYDVAHGRTPKDFAEQALARHAAQKAGALELDFEGSGIGADSNMANYIGSTIQWIRKSKPNLPLRVNVVPYKGQYLPHWRINPDDFCQVAVQCYLGNMDGLVSAEDAIWDVVAWGTEPGKVTAMHPVMCSQRPGLPRQVTLPQARNKAAYYIDDLLLDAGLLP